MTQTPEQPNNIDIRLDRMVQGIDRLVEGMTEFRANLGELTDRLVEGVTEFRADLAEIKEITRQRAQTIAAQQQTLQQLSHRLRTIKQGPSSHRENHRHPL